MLLLLYYNNPALNPARIQSFWYNTCAIVFSTQSSHVGAQLLLQLDLDEIRRKASVGFGVCVLNVINLYVITVSPLTHKVSIPPGTLCQVTDRGSSELLSLV